MKNPETKEEREALLTEWIDLLGLDRWRITGVLNCDPSDIDEHLAGQSEWHSSVKSGTVWVLAEKYHELPDRYDYEQTLIHELLHIKFGMLWDNLDGVARDLLHQTIEELALALVDAKRSAVTNESVGGNDATSRPAQDTQTD